MSSARKSVSNFSNEYFEEKNPERIFGMSPRSKKGSPAPNFPKKSELILERHRKKYENEISTKLFGDSEAAKSKTWSKSIVRDFEPRRLSKKRNFKAFRSMSIEKKSDRKPNVRTRKNKKNGKSLQNLAINKKPVFLESENEGIYVAEPESDFELGTNLEDFGVNWSGYKIPLSLWGDISSLVQHIFVEKKMTQDQFMKLAPCSKIFVTELLKVQLKQPGHLFPLRNFLDLEKIYDLDSKKRSEETFKMLYKLYLKREYSVFMRNYFLENRSDIKPKFESEWISVGKDKKKYFFLHFFSEDFAKFGKDFLMDISAEKIKVKKRNLGGLKKENNWESVENFCMLKTISKAFRYVFLSNPRRRSDFQNFLESESKNGMIGISRAQNEKKIIKQIEKWKIEFSDETLDVAQLLEKFKLSIGDKGFKFPWRLSDLRRFASALKKEKPEDPKLAEEYEIARKGHYSFYPESFEK